MSHFSKKNVTELKADWEGKKFSLFLVSINESPEHWRLFYTITAWLMWTPGIVADVEFRAGDTQHYVEVEILYDGVREMREAFTVHLKPDENMVAEIQVGVSKSCKLPVFMDALPLNSHYKGMFSVTSLAHIVRQTARQTELKVKSTGWALHRVRPWREFLSSGSQTFHQYFYLHSVIFIWSNPQCLNPSLITFLRFCLFLVHWFCSICDLQWCM